MHKKVINGSKGYSKVIPTQADMEKPLSNTLENFKKQEWFNGDKLRARER